MKHHPSSTKKTLLKDRIHYDLSHNNTLTKLLIMSSCIFFAWSLHILLSLPFVSGYELSLYHMFPWYFWFSLLASIILGFIIVLLELVRDSKTRYWTYGLILILMANSLILLLPFFHGYSYGGGADADIYSHVGFIKEIMFTRHFTGNNFYPVIHVFAYISTIFTGFSLSTVLYLIPPLFSIIYILGVYLLTNIISKNHKQTILVTSLACVFLFGGFHHSILPSFLSFTLLPLLLFIFLKRDHIDCRVETTLTLFVFSFFLVFFHPMTTLIAILIFFITYLTNNFIQYINPYLKTYIERITRERAHNMILLLIIAFLTWYTSFQEGISDITGIIQLLFTQPTWEVTTEYVSPLAQANLSLFQIGQLIILRYGSIIIYSILGGIGGLIVLKKLIKDREIDSLSFFYAAHVVGLFCVGLVMMTGYFYNFDPLRVFRFYLMMVTIFNGIMLYQLYKKISIKPFKIKKHHITMIITAIIIVCSLISIFNIYASPIIWQPNRQFTKENYMGSEWMVEHRQPFIQISHDIGTDIRRMDHFLYGLNEENLFLECIFLDIPTHFGYQTHPTLNAYFQGNETYMIPTENGRQAANAFPPYLRDKVDQYTPYDYQKVHGDWSTDKLYANGDVDCWFINS